MSKRHLPWLNSAGGPLILLERESGPYWMGNLETAESRRGEGATHPTDYDRACGVEDYVGLILVGPSQALVLNDEPMQTTWWPLDKSNGMLVRWRWATNEDEVFAVMSNIPTNVWEDTGLNLRFSNGDLILFDSAYHFNEIESSISIRLEAGLYSIQTAEYRPTPTVSLVLHRLTAQ